MTSAKFKQYYDDKNSASRLEHRIKFGTALRADLTISRKRYRGTTDCNVDHNFAPTPSRSKKQLLTRLRNLAETNQVETEMEDVTKGYTSVDCIRNVKKPGVISNFVRSLVAVRDRKQKRKMDDSKHRELANHLRSGLQAGTFRNFVRPADRDDEDDVASWRQEGEMASPARTDFSAYDLFRVQKQMLALAVYYEAMLNTGPKTTDVFATREDALDAAGRTIGVCGRTVRKWRNDFETNNRRFTER